MSVSQKDAIKNLFPKSRILSGVYAVYQYLQHQAHPEKDACLDRIIQNFEPDLTKQERQKRKLSVLYHRYYYQVQYHEYFLFHFQNLNHKGKKEFIGEYERAKICHTLVNDENSEKKQIFRNKYQTFQIFGKYYHREVLLLTPKTDDALFFSFVKRHEQAILKPFDGYSGKGISKICFSEIPDLRAYFSDLIKKGNYVIEEIIQQAEEMAAFHPASVNTIRLATYYTGSEVIYLFCCLRMGAGQSVVDNAGSGGIGAAVDIQTGIVCTAGMNKNGETYLFHPDTNQKIIGFRVPDWENLLALAGEAAKIVPEIPYIAWDFAYMPGGWCMIEANNSGQFGNQYRENKGFRPLVEKYFHPAKSTNHDKR